jgi:hypothetical protein
MMGKNGGRRDGERFERDGFHHDGLLTAEAAGKSDDTVFTVNCKT